jgi:hypothetical protein
MVTFSASQQEMAFGSLLNVRRHLSEVHPEQLGENLAFWRQQFGLTRDGTLIFSRVLEPTNLKLH